jgi:PIN domain nuclease of toxin-antitoxin system
MADLPHLSERARSAISDPENQAFVSVASAWEIAIKRALGKLRLDGNIRTALDEDDFSLLPIGLAHIEAVEHLPQHHRDPFDRMIVAQAGVEKMSLVTCDSEIRLYPVNILW